MTAAVGGTVESLKQLFENHGRSRKNGLVSQPNFSPVHTYSTPEGFERSRNSVTWPSKVVQERPTDSSDDTSCLGLNRGYSETFYINGLSNVLSTHDRSLSMENLGDKSVKRPKPPPVKAKPKIVRRPVEDGSSSSLNCFSATNSIASVTAPTAFHPTTTRNTSIASSSGVSSESADSTPECVVSRSFSSDSTSFAAMGESNGVSVGRNNITSSKNPLSTTSSMVGNGSIRSKVESVESIPFSNTILAPLTAKKTDSAPTNSSENVENRKPKKPPPVPKKPFSVRSGSVASVNSQHQFHYDKELEEKFGVKTKTGSYEYTEAWAVRHGILPNQKKETRKKTVETKNGVSAESDTNSKPQRETSVSSDCDLVSTVSSTRTSSLRSILKKKPSKGPRSNKSISFKDDDELTTNFNYPSERSLSEDSFEMYRPHFYDSDLGSEDEFVMSFGQKYWENPPSSSCSTLVSDKDTVTSSSTVRGRSSSRGTHSNSPTLEIGSSASNYSGSFKRFLPESRRPRLSH